MQQLRDLLLQLKADNEQLLRERTASGEGPGGAASGSSGYAPTTGVAPPPFPG